MPSRTARRPGVWWWPLQPSWASPCRPSALPLPSTTASAQRSYPPTSFRPSETTSGPTRTSDCPSPASSCTPTGREPEETCLRAPTTPDHSLVWPLQGSSSCARDVPFLLVTEKQFIFFARNKSLHYLLLTIP
uniref:Putative secreted protein n=1 Tax=Ixodes scapularis TaxID=6945 RepID=A0A4D5RAJ7_IXOSC